MVDQSTTPEAGYTGSKTPIRSAVLILGMHRSGTSALAGVLVRLGATAPRSLMPPSNDNPRGYWESDPIRCFHDRLLASAGSRWKDWDRFNPGWLESPASQPLLDEFGELIVQEFGTAPLFILKDPRICRFVHVCLRGLEPLNIAPKVIMPVRNPLEVASSLNARDKLTIERALLAWLRHVLDAEVETRHLPRCVVTFESLMQDWRATVADIATALDLKWPKWSTGVEMDIDDFLANELRHHRVPEETLYVRTGLYQWIGDTYRALKQLATDPSNAEQIYETLDDVRNRFNAGTSIFGTVARAQENQTDALLVSVAELKKANQTLSAARDSLDSARERLQGLLASSEQSLKALRAESEQSRATLENEIDRLRAEAVARTEQEAQTQRRHDEEQQTLKERIRELDASLNLRFNELSKMTRMLRERDQVRQQMDDELRRYRRPVELLKSSGLWGATKPLRFAYRVLTSRFGRAARTLAADQALIRKSKYFDSAWYLSQNPDVAARGMDPIEHYVRFGALEERDPGPTFSTMRYIAFNPDVAASGLNPLVHYLRHGQKENRRI